MTTYLGKSCSFCLPRVSFVNCRQFMYLVISLLVLRAGYGIWLYQFLIIAYLFTFLETDKFYKMKVGTYSQINEYVAIYDRSRSFIDHCPRSLMFNSSTVSNFFSSETARRIEAKFHMESPWDLRNESCSNFPGHMTMPIYGKNIQKTSFSEPRSRRPWNLVYSIGYLITTIFFFKWWPWIDLDLDHLMKVSNLFPDASVWVTVNTALNAHVFPSLF